MAAWTERRLRLRRRRRRNAHLLYSATITTTNSSTAHSEPASTATSRRAGTVYWMQLISSVLRASAPICAYSTRHSSTHHRLFQASFFLWGDYPTARRPQLFDICCRRRHSAANPPAAVAAVDRRDRRAEGRSTVARTRRRIHPIPRQKNLQFRPPPNACQIVYSESFFGRDNELHIFHGNYLLMDNKHRKLFVITQSEGRKFMPKMHQNTLGGRAPPRPAGGNSCVRRAAG